MAGHLGVETPGDPATANDFQVKLLSNRSIYCDLLSTRDLEKYAQRNSSKSTQVDAEYVSTVEASIREKSRPRHVSLHNNRRSHHTKNWTCGTPRSCAQCALCIANEVTNWNVQHSVEELRRGAEHTRHLRDCHLVHCRQGHELAPDRLQVHKAMTNVPGRLQVQTRRTTGQNSSMDSYTTWDWRCT